MRSHGGREYTFYPEESEKPKKFYKKRFIQIWFTLLKVLRGYYVGHEMQEGKDRGSEGVRKVQTINDNCFV
jgi:hypothetical protein